MYIRLISALHYFRQLDAWQWLLASVTSKGWLISFGVAAEQGVPNWFLFRMLNTKFLASVFTNQTTYQNSFALFMVSDERKLQTLTTS
jgi:hypothetical protein